MTDSVFELRRLAEEYIEIDDARKKDRSSYSREQFIAAQNAYHEAVSPERVVALCEAAIMVSVFCNQIGDPKAATERAFTVYAQLQAAFAQEKRGADNVK